MHIGVLLNTASGALQQKDPEKVSAVLDHAFSQTGHTTNFAHTDGASLERDLEALADRSDAIFVAGGDGTVTAAASQIAGTTKSLGILPFGTMNLVARDLGLTPWSEDLASRLAHGTTRRIDIATVNGQIFLHSVVMGAFAEIAESRETVRDEQSLSSLGAFVTTLSSRLLFDDIAQYTVFRKKGRFRFQTRSLLVSNNKIVDRAGFGLFRSRLDRGRLYLYVPNDRGALTTAETMFRFLTGRWNGNNRLTCLKANALEIQGKGPRATLSIDGEVREIPMPLQFEIQKQKLEIWVPRQ